MRKILFIAFIIFLILVSLKIKFVTGTAVLCAYIFFIFISLKKGNSFSSVMDISYEYGKKVFPIILIFIFVGTLTATWIASGTIPGIVYFGIKFINPNIFILFSFLISSCVSFLSGSSFGSASTIGVALMAIARSGNVDVNIVGADIISGIYFGDRWSPVSSSANLVAALTDTNLYESLKNCVKSMLVPFGLSVIFYGILSGIYSLNTAESRLMYLIEENYNLDVKYIFIPLAVILIMSVFKINVKISMGISSLLAAFVGIFIQNETVMDILKYSIFGFYKFNGTELEKIIKGGGIMSMLTSMIVVISSCAMIGVFKQINVLKAIKEKVQHIKTRAGLFAGTFFTAVITGMIGCNQTISIVMTEQIMEDIYKEKGISKKDLGKDLENTGVVTSGLIPWCIACFVPCAMLGINNIKFIPFAFYLWLLPLCSWIYYKFFYKD